MPRTDFRSEQINKMVGERIAVARLSRGLARTDLAQKINITHQQLSKYEKGTNRVSVGRLIVLLEALRYPLTEFFNDIGIKLDNSKYPRVGLELMKNFVEIKNKETQNTINNLVKSMARGENHGRE